jgi:hypothetical protein
LDLIKTETFDTVLGQTHFDNYHLFSEECFPGQVGQWQNSVFEVVAPSGKATAEFIYPKPDWPK